MIKRKNRWESGDKEFYSFDFEPLNCEREEVADYVKVKAGIDFLHNRKDDDNPFFLFLPLLQPHPSYTTHRDFYDMYDPQGYTGFETRRAGQKAGFLRAHQKVPPLR